MVKFLIKMIRQQLITTSRKAISSSQWSKKLNQQRNQLLNQNLKMLNKRNQQQQLILQLKLNQHNLNQQPRLSHLLKLNQQRSHNQQHKLSQQHNNNQQLFRLNRRLLSMNLWLSQDNQETYVLEL